MNRANPRRPGPPIGGAANNRSGSVIPKTKSIKKGKKKNNRERERAESEESTAQENPPRIIRRQVQQPIVENEEEEAKEEEPGNNAQLNFANLRDMGDQEEQKQPPAANRPAPQANQLLLEQMNEEERKAAAAQQQARIAAGEVLVRRRTMPGAPIVDADKVMPAFDYNAAAEEDRGRQLARIINKALETVPEDGKVAAREFIMKKIEFAPNDYLDGLESERINFLFPNLGPDDFMPQATAIGAFTHAFSNYSKVIPTSFLKIGKGGKLYKTIRIPKVLLKRKQVIPKEGKRNPYPTLYMGLLNFLWYHSIETKISPTFIRVGFAWAKAQMGVTGSERPSLADWAALFKTGIPGPLMRGYLASRRRGAAYKEALREKRLLGINLGYLFKEIEREFEASPARAITLFMQLMNTYTANAADNNVDVNGEIDDLVVNYAGNYYERKKGIDMTFVDPTKYRRYRFERVAGAGPNAQQLATVPYQREEA